MAAVSQPRHKLNPYQQKYILDGILKDKSAKDLCKELGISSKSLYDQIIIDPFFAKQYKQIREIWMHDQVEGLIKIADDCVTMAEVQRAKVKSDNIKWSASKAIPETYGDNLNLNVSHHLDLSSVLLAAENRVIPILQAKQNVISSADSAVDAEIIETAGVLIDSVKPGPTNEMAISNDVPDELKDLI